MHDDEQIQRERISALADGQLDAEELAQTVAWLARSDEARSAWHSYHVVGDVLRGVEGIDCSGDRLFVARLRERLTQVQDLGELDGDAGPDAGRTADPARPLHPVRVAELPGAADHSANDALVRWKWLAAAASMMAVAVLGWHVGYVSSDASARLAAAPPGAVVSASGNADGAAAEPPVMLRDPRLDELLAAHRQFGGTSALQMPAGFLRNATFENPGR